jgi:hypothetical protein
MKIPKRGSGHAARLYALLEIEPTATEEELKKAYKKMALKYHPDKNPGQEEKFKEISNAYNILLDPSRKEVYDVYGDEGVALYENGVFGEDGEFMHFMPFLQNPAFVGLFACLLLIGWILAFLFALFIVLKVDGDVDWNWGVVFVPMWIINVVPFCYVCALPKISSTKLKGLASAIQLMSLFVFEILLCIQLHREEHNRSNTWKWSVVFIPVYIEEFLHILKRISMSTQKKYKEEVEAQTSGFMFGIGYLGYLLRKLFIPAMRVWFVVFLMLKLDEKVSWSWWINAIPLFVGIGWKVLVTIADDVKMLKKATDAEEQAKTKAVLIGMSVIILLMLSVVLAFIILVVIKLDDATAMSLAKVFIPAFIVFGLGCCCLCCLPILCCCCAPAPDEENPFEYENPTEGNAGEEADKKFTDSTQSYQNGDEASPNDTSEVNHANVVPSIVEEAVQQANSTSNNNNENNNNNNAAEPQRTTNDLIEVD